MQALPLPLALLAATLLLAPLAAASFDTHEERRGKDGDEGGFAFDAGGDDGVGTAARLGALGVLAGTLAYFWPSLRLMVAAPLYTRIRKDQALEHDTRDAIYRLIREEPGVHAQEIADRAGIPFSTAAYHLRLLERSGLVVARPLGRYRRFFVTGDARVRSQDAVALLRGETSGRIARTVAERPGLIQKELCSQLSLSSALASWHLRRLQDAGLVKAERQGRTVRYLPGPAWEQLGGA